MKNRFYLNVKIKLLTVLLVAVFLLSALVVTQLIGEVSAAIAYTQYTGTLDGADWALRIPDPWNGMLVILCRPAGDFLQNPTTILSIMGGSMLNAGFAIAASNFGEAPNIPIGIDSTYQLTMHIIDNFDANGKIFLYGLSLGGPVAMLLGEEYPDVYSGVLDVSGVKDLKSQYYRSERIVAMTDEELEAELTALGSQIPPYLYSSLDAFREFMAGVVTNMIATYGGSPDTHPQAYEKFSSTYHADIQIPVIAVHGTADANIPYSHAVLLENAVAKVGSAYLYRLYAVQGGQHASADVLAEADARFNELVEWSNELTGSSDWPMFGHDPQRSGYSTSNAPNTNQTLWVSTMGGGAGSHPAVVDDKVYVCNYDRNVYCFDATTGTKIWNYTTGGALLCNPAVADGKIYVSSNDDNVYCLDAVTGTKIWNYATGGVPGSGPVVANGKVYVGADDGKLYCLRADWGQVEWKFTTGGSVLYAAVADGKVYFGSFDKKVYCVSASTGALIWSYTTGDEVWGSPTIVDGKVFVGSYDDNVYCLDAASGTKIWSYTTGNDVYSSPAVAYGKLYVGSTDNNVYCLNPETGTLIWSYSTGGGVFGAPTVADGKVYVGSMDRTIYCLDATTGAFIWSYKSGNMVVGSPVVANGVAYAVSMDRNVYAFSPWAPVPEGLTIDVILLLSTVAVIVSMRYFRKRLKWENW